MPPVLPSKDIADLPKLYTNTQAREYLGIGVNKWTRVKRAIDCLIIDGRQLYTREALLAYLKRITRKAAPSPRKQSASQAAAERHKQSVTV